MSRVAKKAAKYFKLIAVLQGAKGAEAVTARRKLREMRDVRYSTDPTPSAGAAWKPDGHNMARGKQTMRKSAPK